MKSVLVVGLGSLTKKIIYNLATQGNVNIIVISRSTESHSWLTLCGLCENVNVSFVQGSGLDMGLLTRALNKYQPDLVINGASLISPFCLVNHPKADAVRGAGFALQIGSQLSVIMAVMQVVKEVCPDTPVVNCSFPDLTNFVLSKVGLAPTAGIGNVSMLEMIAKNVIRNSATCDDRENIQVLAHHAHVLPVLRNNAAELSQQPLVFCNEQKLEKVFEQVELSLSDEEINHFTAISAMPVIKGLLWQDRVVRCSAPGVLGIAGGVPIIIENGTVRTDLPRGLTNADVTDYFNEALLLDGVSRVERDGTIHFSQKYIELLSKVSAKLTEPFRPIDCLERHQLFLDTFFPE
jgi:hypothetical protein